MPNCTAAGGKPQGAPADHTCLINMMYVIHLLTLTNIISIISVISIDLDNLPQTAQPQEVSPKAARASKRDRQRGEGDEHPRPRIHASKPKQHLAGIWEYETAVGAWPPLPRVPGFRPQTHKVNT